mgnify:CR=1 FL=1
MDKKMWLRPDVYQLDIENTEASYQLSENCDNEWIEDGIKYRSYS